MTDVPTQTVTGGPPVPVSAGEPTVSGGPATRPGPSDEVASPPGAGAASSLRTFLWRPWRGTVLWRGLARAALNVVFGYAIGFLIVTLIGFTAGLVLTVILAVPAVWLAFTVAAGLGRVERSRAAALLDVNLPWPHAPFAPGGWWSRFRQRLTSASRWRELAYLALGLPALGALGFLLILVVAGLCDLVAMPFYVPHLPGRYADVAGVHIYAGPEAVLALVVGVVGLAVIAPQATLGLVWLDRQVVCLLLGPRRTEVLEGKVTELEVRREAAVDSAEAERRRIERDLHDGVQQRLVALAMDLGRARERFDTDPDRARQLVDEAHEEAKAALTELRDLARGIHPAVLADRGLDAALSSVVSRCPVPVSLSVDVPTRPSAAVESAAYFVVAEALTNVAKHAQATRAHVTIAAQNNRLIVEVRDDGVGNAAATPGSGLAGLEDRVAALGGWMRIISPSKGPTTIVVELPCGS